MAKSMRKIKAKKEKQVDELKKELIANDMIHKKNIEEKRTQVQIGLYKKGFPQTSPMYDSLLERCHYELEETQIKLDSNFETFNPIFKFQQNERWIEIQKIYAKKQIEAIKSHIEEIKTNVEEVEKDIVEQNARIVARRVQILVELDKRGVDISEFSKTVPKYIG